jgi:son of sevenless
MKADKKSRAEHIILMTKRFNDGARLVGSEIVSRLEKSLKFQNKKD